MNNALFALREPQNEPVKAYAPNSIERKLLSEELDRQYKTVVDIPLIIGGKEVRTGNMGDVVMPTEHKHVLAHYHKCTEKEVKMAIKAALAAREQWANMPWVERASIMMRIAELLATKYRYVINAACMLGQGKNPMQAEIDSACETIDFLRFNPYYMGKIYADQPASSAGCINRTEYRGMEGFVYTVTPFNFTSIAVNLNVSPVMMGNVTVWKPATTSLLSSYYAMKIMQEAGVPDGVINFLPGSGELISSIVLKDAHLAGIHFTGSTSTFQNFWTIVGKNIKRYNTYPKLVGETGGKDFIFVHQSANAREVAVAIARGAFEFQGQKCSAASRAYIPQSLWNDVRTKLEAMVKEMKVGDVRDFTNFVNAVIDEKSFDNLEGYIKRAKASKDAEVIIGGKCDKKVGYFIYPTVILAKTPKYETMCEELFGPVITIYVYQDEEYEKTLRLCDQTSPYALTGCIWSNDRYATQKAMDMLRHAAGNFYINDKPTGAVVGQQPFGGARASGTNDKAGSMLNLIRWTSPRAIKETLVPPTDYKYPFLEK